MRLPGMEVLGFYDEPYQVAVRRPPRPSKPSTVVTSAPSPASDARSRVSALWETTEISAGALDWWKPQAVARRKLGGRRLRMSSLGAIMVVGGVLIAFLLFAVQGPDRVAQESMITLRSDATALSQSLAPLESLVTSIGNAEAPDLSASTATALEAESAARNLFADARDLTGPARNEAVAAAGSVLEATSRTNRLIAYRLSAENALIRPSLATSPDKAELPSATEAVTAWRAQVETSLAELAPNVLPDHRAALDEWLAGLGTWQTSYLDDVRAADGAAMAAAVEELGDQIDSLHRGLLDELAEGGGELLSELADARKALERLLAG